MSETIVKLAVLIDADNAQPNVATALLAEVAKYGTAFVRRAYGDWTGTSLRGWKNQLLTQSIQPIQQFAYTQGKNATDSAMIIDAMDLLYTNRFDGFCLVSSDSDFTRLAARIRESGLVVYGFGERKTPKPFVAACDKFIYFENITPVLNHGDNDNESPGVSVPRPQPVTGPATEAPPTATTTAAAAGTTVNDIGWLEMQLRAAVTASSDEEGWASLSQVGDHITKQHPDFDSRTFGHPKLSGLVLDKGWFDITRRKGVIYIRPNSRKRARSD